MAGWRILSWKMCCAPLRRQLAGGCDGKHRLPESLEQSRKGSQAIITGLDPGQQGVELIGDASLFLMRGKGGDIMDSS